MTLRLLSGVLFVFVLGCACGADSDLAQARRHAVAPEDARVQPEPVAASGARTPVLQLGEGAWLGLPKDACSLEVALQRELGTVDAVDCGTLPRFALASMRMAAQECVLAAQAAKRAYRVSYHPPSYDSLESAGITSKGDGAHAVLLHKSSTPGGPYWQRARLGMHHCSEVVAMQDCDFAQGDLCLNCMAVGLGHALCEAKEAL